MPRFLHLLLLAGLFAGCTTRPTLAPHGTFGPEWAPFAAYTQRAVARIQKQWGREIAQMKPPPPAGSKVIVVFSLTPDGKISRIEDVKTESDAAAKACLYAITWPGTFGIWTGDMRKELGSEQKLTFTFSYQ